MYRFQLPYYNIAGCDAELNEDRLVEWLVEHSGENFKRDRIINQLDTGFPIMIPADCPKWEQYWCMELPGVYEFINTTGCSAWMHYRITRCKVRDDGWWDDLSHNESECYFEIADEYLALQFKLIM